MLRGDWKENLNHTSKLGDLSEMTISPIIEQRVAMGFLDNDDLPDGFR